MSQIRFPLLHSFSEDEQQNLLNRLPRVMFEDGGMIFECGEETTDVYFILEGATKSVTYGPKGGMAYFYLRKAGDFFGYYSAISGEARTATMIALGPTVLAKMGGGDFMEMILSHKALSEYMLKLVTGLLRSETKRITNLITMDVRGCIAAEIVSLSIAQKASTVEIPSRDELSSRLGIARETLARHLSFFVQEGLLDIRKEKICILDMEGLHAFFA